MKKTLLLIAPALMLASCGENTIDKNVTKGVIDCYSIRVTNGGSTVFSETYQISYASVYEYKNEKENTLYFNQRYRSYSYDYNTGTENYVDTPVTVYPNRYKSDFDTYNFSRFVGYLTYENNYLLDFDGRIIDSEVKYSKYLNSTNPGSEEGNNKEVYEKAKKVFILQAM